MYKCEPEFISAQVRPNDSWVVTAKILCLLYEKVKTHKNKKVKYESHSLFLSINMLRIEKNKNV